MPFEVRLLEPWLSRVLPDGTEEVPLSSLRDSDAHIHGELVIIVDGARLPHLGFFGPRDVCLGTWLRELTEAKRVLGVGTEACHLFDEGEQGQPAFRFQRVSDRVDVTIVDAAFSGGIGDPEWGTRSCTLAEFDLGVSTFLNELEASLESAAPGVGRAWVRDHTSTG